MIVVPTEEEIRQQRSRHAAVNAVWQSVLQGRCSPATISYVLDPPGKLSQVQFSWSTEDKEDEDAAVSALESLSPADGIATNVKHWGTGYWLGTGDEQEEIRALQSTAYDLARCENEAAAENQWQLIIYRCQTRLGPQLPETAKAYFGYADCCLEFGKVEEHDRQFGRGLEVLEQCFQRKPMFFAEPLRNRLVEFAHLHLIRNDKAAAEAQYAELERIRDSAPCEMRAYLKPDWALFARWYEQKGLLEQAEQAYLAHAALLSGVDLGSEDVALLEVADFFVRHQQFGKAEGFYEQLLLPFVMEKPSARDFFRNKSFHWFLHYKKILHLQGRQADLAKLNERLAAKEIAAGRRVAHHNALGYIDLDGAWKIQPRYLEASDFKGGVSIVRVGVEGANDCSERIIDLHGNDLGLANEPLPQLPDGYNFCWPDKFFSGLAVVRQNKPASPKKNFHEPNLYGYCDESGQIVIAPQFTDAQPFRNDQAVVALGGYIGGQCVIELQSGRYGLIDRAGNYVVEPQFSQLKYFSKTLYRFRRGTSGGVIDRDGNIVTELPECHDSFYLEDGDETVTVQWGDDQKYGYLDAHGQILLPAQFDYASYFSDGLAFAQMNGRGGYIDKTGNFVIAPQFCWSGEFVDGVAIVQIDKKYGCINKQGKRIVDTVFDRIDGFEEGIAQVTRDGKKGLIDKSGNLLCQLEYDKIGRFSNGQAIVERNTKKGMIDRAGQIVVPLRFVDLQPFHDGLAPAAILPDGATANLWGFIDQTGAFVIAPQYDFADSFRQERAKVGIGPKSERLFGIIDTDGKYILKPEYRVVQSFAEGLCVAGGRVL